MPTIAQHIAARDDRDLQQRLVAAAEMSGVPAPARWVAEHSGALACTPIEAPDGSTTTIADVHAYAAAVYADKLADLGPLPGANAAAVTDDHLKAAVAAVRGSAT
ncbi:hypothetical protein [Nocardioides sp. SYSU D00065]|uniref:hypothetical protein n=1 Tax=Nocardioides sp. SYSU D00065 TaxID=2817378 RepID=UPI001B339D18|nr:hypothetical protein [Nocardioides sp. SYSU D00065]